MERLQAVYSKCCIPGASCFACSYPLLLIRLQQPVADLSSQTSEKQRLDHYPLRAQQKLWAEQSVRLGWGSPVAIDSSLPPAGCCAPTWARVIWVLGCSGAVHAPASWSALRNPSDVREAAAPSSWCGKGLLPSSCWPLAVSSWDGASVCGEGIWA